MQRNLTANVEIGHFKYATHRTFKVAAKIDFKMNDVRDPGILFWKGLHVSGLNVYHAEKSPNIDIIDHYFNNFHNFPSTFETTTTKYGYSLEHISNGKYILFTVKI